MNVKRRLTSVIPRRINYGLSDLRGDFLGGAAAAGVTIPVCTGYGVISGLGAAAGLYGAVAVGIFASLFWGTRGMTYGPNILIAVTMAVVVTEYADSLAQAATIGILAGLIQILFGFLGLGRYASYIPVSLTSGFFTAFGILLITKQILIALGSSPDNGSVIDVMRDLPEAIVNVNWDALILTVICLALSVLWRGWFLRLSPTSFVLLTAGILGGVLWFQDAPVVGYFPSGLPELQLSALSLEFFLRALHPAFVMALLGSVATFITALKVDTITGFQHRPNREMFGQGIGNIAAGFTGGLAGAVGPGTFINTYGGGRTPVSGLTVVALTLAAILFLEPVVERIPLAVLAAVLIANGWSIIDWRFLSRIHRISRSYVLVMLMTCFLVLFVDLISAIVIPLVIAALTGARRLENLETAAVISVPLLDRAVLEDADWDDESDPFQARTGLVVFPEQVTVASARELSRILRPDIRGHQIAIFDMSRTVYVDDSAAVIISELIGIATAQQSKTIIIAGLTQDVADTLHSMGLLDRVPQGNFATDMEEAKQIIRPMLRQQCPGAQASRD